VDSGIERDSSIGLNSDAASARGTAAHRGRGLLRPILALVVVSAIWGSHPVISKIVEGQMTPLALTVWRFTLGAVCYLPWLHRTRAILRRPPSVLWRLAVTALFWCVLYPLLYYQALRSLPPLDTLLIINSAPLLAALLAWLFLRERLRTQEWLGIVVALGGVVVLTGRQLSLHASVSGLTLAVCAAVSFAAYTVLSRKLFQELALFDVLLATSVVGAASLWLYTAVTGRVGEVYHELLALNAPGWWQFLYIAIAVSAFAYILYGYGLARLPAAISSAITFYPQVVFAGLVQWVWLGQTPTDWTWLAAAFILAGTFLMSRKPKANRRQ